VALAIALGLFAGSRMVAVQTAIDLPPGEVIEHAGPANHILHFEARGGRLYLTNRHMIFQPHRFNLQQPAVRIPPSEIAGAWSCMSLGVVPNGLLVSLKDGPSHRFVVSDRAEWVRMVGGGRA